MVVLIVPGRRPRSTVPRPTVRRSTLRPRQARSRALLDRQGSVTFRQTSARSGGAAIIVQSTDELDLRPVQFSSLGVAVLRASGDPEKLAHQPLKLSRQLEYEGRLHPINRSRAAILGWSYRPDLGRVDATLLHQAPGGQRLVGALGRPSWFAAAQAELLAECNINPVRLRQSGCPALDCLLVLREPIERHSA